MLYLQYNTPEVDRLRNPGGTFNSLYEKSWFENPTVVKIAEGVDGVKHVMEDIFEHETFGKFLATQLSGGAKILILAYLGILPDKAYPLSWLGDNCYEWLKVIPEEQDITFDADCMIPPFCSYVNFTIKATGEVIDSERKYFWGYNKYRDFNVV